MILAIVDLRFSKLGTASKFVYHTEYTTFVQFEVGARKTKSEMDGRMDGRIED
jgi:hypothetical protein